MTTSERSNRAVFDAIRHLLQHGETTSMREIARVSTYSLPTVARAIQALEQAGYIEIDRSTRAHRRNAPHQYAILREISDMQTESAPRC